MLALGAIFSFVAMPLLFTLPSWGWSAVPAALYILFGAILFGYTQARVTNLALGRTTLEGGVRVSSTLSARRLTILYIQNLLAISATLGLAIPWAAVRTTRYRMACLGLDCDGNLDAFVGQAAGCVGATGEAMGEMFDVDLSL
jgi:uncharacterized membrane protein YjgN (DUF898 family)